VRRVLLACLWVSVAPIAARAAPDYAPDNREWNGLSDLATIAAGRGLTVEARGEIDWAELGAADVLFIVYPTSRVEPAHLAAFLRGGGRALVADDFGRADEALARLGILRRPAPRIPRSHEGNPHLPLAAPTAPGHPLARGVSELATNHPSSFSVARGPDLVFGYGGGAAVVVAGQLGAGSFVALSDPSVLINAMLAFDGNLTFAVNLLDLLAPARPGRIVLITRDARIAGEPVAPEDDGEPMTTNELLAELARFLDELNDYLATGATLHLVSAGLGGLALIFGVLLPLRRARDPDAGFARPGGELPGAGRILAHLDDDRGERSYGYPAALLRAGAEAEMERAAAAPGPGRALARQALALLRALPGERVSRRQFVEAHSAVTAARKASHGH
jgi:hypothetical protein